MLELSQYYLLLASGGGVKRGSTVGAGGIPGDQLHQHHPPYDTTAATERGEGAGDSYQFHMSLDMLRSNR